MNIFSNVNIDHFGGIGIFPMACFDSMNVMRNANDVAIESIIEKDKGQKYLEVEPLSSYPIHCIFFGWEILVVHTLNWFLDLFRQNICGCVIR